MAPIIGTCPRCRRENVALDENNVCSTCHEPFMREVDKKVEDLYVRSMPRGMRSSARRNYRRMQGPNGGGCALLILAAAALPAVLVAGWILIT